DPQAGEGGFCPGTGLLPAHDLMQWQGRFHREADFTVMPTLALADRRGNTIHGHGREAVACIARKQVPQHARQGGHHHQLPEAPPPPDMPPPPDQPPPPLLPKPPPPPP